MTRTVLLIAGEVSGDLRAAELVRALRARAPGVRFIGIGGDELEAAGMEVLFHVRDMAVMGLVEVLRRYGFFRRVFRKMVELARDARPDLVVLVDYPGFNIRFARAMKRLGIPCVYYICPQVWAWHRSRIPELARLVRRILAIFPFEPEVFKGTGLRVEYVGHPLVEAARRARAAVDDPLPWSGAPPVALLPGSRQQEVRRILPVMIEAAERLRERHPSASFLVAAHSEEIAELAGGLLGNPEGVQIVSGRTGSILRQARAALVASGTATLETALLGCPQIVVYRTSPLTYFAARRLVRVPHIGMVNLIAGRRLCPEFVQGAARPEVLAAALEPLLLDTPERAAMLAGYRDVEAALGQGKAADRAAECLIEELGL